MEKEVYRTNTLASSRPKSLTGVPDLGETKQLSDNSSRPIIRPGHHDPFLLRTQTNPPTDASIPFVFEAPVLPISPNKAKKPKEKEKKKNQSKHAIAEKQSSKLEPFGPEVKNTVEKRGLKIRNL